MKFGKPWSYEEEQLLNKETDAFTLQKQLKEKGFSRSVEAIKRKLRRIVSIEYVSIGGKKFSIPLFTFDDAPPRSKNVTITSTKEIKWVNGPLPLSKDKPTKFVMLNDVHVPDNIPLDNVFKFIEEYKPDYMLLVGDIVNNTCFSHWDRNSPLRFKEMPQPKPYFEKCNKMFYRPLRAAVGPNCKLVHWIGNHEYWSNKAIAERPDGEGYWECENNIEEIDMWVPSKGVANLGKLHFLHGDILKSSNGCARRMVQLFHRSIRFGHFHHIEEASQTNPLDVKDIHTARTCGTLEKLNPHYMNGQPTNWVNAFTYGIVLPSGKFHDHTTVITDNSFMANGKIYG